MSRNILGVTALQRNVSNLFYSVSKFEQKKAYQGFKTKAACQGFKKKTPKELIIIQKQLFKLIIKSISKYPKVSTILKLKELSRTHGFHFSSF